MNIDTLLTQMDTYESQTACPNCKNLNEQLALMLEVVKAKEAEINDLGVKQQHLLEDAKNQLRSEAEKKLREQLTLQLQAQLRRELKPQIIDEIRQNFTKYLTKEEQAELQRQISAPLQEQADLAAMSKIDALVREKTSTERTELRTKISEYEALRARLEDDNALKKAELRYQRQVQQIYAQNSREISRLSLRIQALQKDNEQLKQQQEEDLSTFKAEKANLERCIEELRMQLQKPQVADQEIELSALKESSGNKEQLGESAAIQTSIFAREIQPNDKQQLLGQLYGSGRRELPVGTGSVTSAAAGTGSTKGATSTKLANKMVDSRVLHVEDLRENNSEREVNVLSLQQKLSSEENSFQVLRKQVSQKLKDEKFQQEVFNTLPAIELPDTQIGKMLENAFTFLFDYFDKCETSFIERISIVRAIQSSIQKNQMDAALKSMQAELLRLRDDYKLNGEIYGQIKLREATKNRGQDQEFDRKLARSIAGKAVLYRGISYFDILRADGVVV